MNIRRAKSADMEAVLQLIKELAHFEREPEAVVVTVEDLIKDGFGENPLFGIFVAEVDSKIVGMALYHYKYSTWKGKTIHLEDLIVTNEFRGKGIGSKLLTKMVVFANEDKVKRLEWNVLDWNTPAVELYEKSGANILKEWLLVRLDEKGIADYIEGKL